MILAACFILKDHGTYRFTVVFGSGWQNEYAMFYHAGPSSLVFFAGC